MLLPLIVFMGCNRAEFVINIDRQFADAFEEDLIRTAVSICPTVEERQSEFEFISSEGTQECMENRLFAITIKTIENIADDIAREQEEWRTDPSLFWFRVTNKLEYSASVQHHENFEYEETSFADVYVVTMDLSHFVACGPLCGHLFIMYRIVVFGTDGMPDTVFGDGDFTGYIN